jgi:hypothetical protein
MFDVTYVNLKLFPWYYSGLRYCASPYLQHLPQLATIHYQRSERQLARFGPLLQLHTTVGRAIGKSLILTLYGPMFYEHRVLM